MILEISGQPAVYSWLFRGHLSKIKRRLCLFCGHSTALEQSAILYVASINQLFKCSLL